MLWKLLGLQKLFDELFDTRWCCLGGSDMNAFAHEEAPDAAQV